MLLCLRRFFHRIKAGRPILVPGSGLQVRLLSLLIPQGGVMQGNVL